MRFPPFDTYGMDDDEVLLLKETCDALSSAYKTEFVNLNHRKDLSPLFKDLGDNIAGVALIENQFKTCILVFIKVFFRQSKLFMPKSELRHNSFQVYAFCQLRKNFGTVFIRRRTLKDKILGIFLSVTVRFKNYKIFNRKFYVLSDDKQKAAVTINNEMISLLLHFSSEDFIINISNRKLVVESPDAPSSQSTLKMAEFACSMSVI